MTVSKLRPRRHMAVYVSEMLLNIHALPFPSELNQIFKEFVISLVQKPICDGTKCLVR